MSVELYHPNHYIESQNMHKYQNEKCGAMQKQDKISPIVKTNVNNIMVYHLITLVLYICLLVDFTKKENKITGI